jgi:Tfp pilus assembly protein PilN
MWSKTPSTSVGITISARRMEGVLFDLADQQIKASFGYDLPAEVFDHGQIKDETYLKQTLINLMKHLGMTKQQKAHIAIAADLFRVMEMPKLDYTQMQLALSSEAERFRAFDNTEAVVEHTDLFASPESRKQHVLVVGVRKDTLETVAQICNQAKLGVLSLSTMPLETLRGFAGSGLLGGVTQVAGNDACWGCLLYEGEYVRLVVCQGTTVQTLREIQINLSQAAQESLFLIEDLVDEIQRTIRQFTPVVWFVDGLPGTIHQLLQQRLSVPLKTLTLPDTVVGSHDVVSLATLGSSVTPYVSFPFEVNLLRHVKGIKLAKPTQGRVGGNAGSAGASSGLLTHPTTKVAAVLAGLMLISWGAFAVMQATTANAITQLTTEKDNLTNQLTQKRQQLAELKEKSSIQAQLLDTVQRIRAQNTIYQKLARDLRMKTPASVWLHTIKAGTELSLEGKALEHQSVINLARSFDSAVYVRDLDFESVKEALVGPKAVYEFKLTGVIQPSNTLIQDSPAVASLDAPRVDSKNNLKKG